MSGDLEHLRERVVAHQVRLRKRGAPMAAESVPPTGQAADWYYDVLDFVPRGERGTAWHVARQIARLCGDDSQVSMPWRSLADAVGKGDKLGRPRAYAESGVAVLASMGWLQVETVGRGRGAKTTFRLLPGERIEYRHLPPTAVMASIREPWLEPPHDDLDAELAALAAESVPV